ncbi:hypothetical protein [Frateuria defendens]|uniref:hypothetical protein n=1 Tax=Frateuria defendens TaxID=2219559 RepID=UPI001292ECD9|nr:hypothetical protein [Frateuria defendens]
MRIVSPDHYRFISHVHGGLMKRAVLTVALVALVSGCTSKTDPGEKNFGAAIDAYLGML